MRRLLSILAATWFVATPIHAEGTPDAANVEKVRQALTSAFKDPMSAQIEITKGPWEGTATIAYRFYAGELACVRINAKNSYGGYVGFRSYLVVMAADGQSALWSPSDPSRGTDRQTREACNAPMVAPAASPEPQAGVTFR